MSAALPRLYKSGTSTITEVVPLGVPLGPPRKDSADLISYPAVKLRRPALLTLSPPRDDKSLRPFPKVMPLRLLTCPGSNLLRELCTLMDMNTTANRAHYGSERGEQCEAAPLGQQRALMTASQTAAQDHCNDGREEEGVRARCELR